MIKGKKFSLISSCTVRNCKSIIFPNTTFINAIETYNVLHMWKLFIILIRTYMYFCAEAFE